MNGTFRVAVCDDDSRYAEGVMKMAADCLEEIGQTYEFLYFPTGEALIEACEQLKNLDIHLLILDIEMGQMNGIAVKDVLTKRNEVKRIIFLTNHKEAMPMAFGLRVIGFLEKPVGKERLNQWIRVVLGEMEKNTELSYQNNREEQTIRQESIKFIQAEGDYTLLYRVDCDASELVRQTMKYWEKKLEGSSIIRVHKSYFVNLAHVKKIGNMELIMDDEVLRIPVGRTYRDKVRENYQIYQMELARNRVWIS